MSALVFSERPMNLLRIYGKTSISNYYAYIFRPIIKLQPRRLVTLGCIYLRNSRLSIKRADMVNITMRVISRDFGKGKSLSIRMLATNVCLSCRKSSHFIEGTLYIRSLGRNDTNDTCISLVKYIPRSISVLGYISDVKIRSCVCNIRDVQLGDEIGIVLGDRKQGKYRQTYDKTNGSVNWTGCVRWNERGAMNIDSLMRPINDGFGEGCEIGYCCMDKISVRYQSGSSFINL